MIVYCVNCICVCISIQVKIWKTESGSDNCNVTVVTEDMDCDVKNLLVYTGHSDITPSRIATNRAHFQGNHKLLSLESSVTSGNGQNECVFRCEDICYYVFIYVRNVPNETSWKICEVFFN